jgi:hypothetical protein
MSAPARLRPLVAVVFRVPLFVEALTAAFDGLADVQGLRAVDGELDGLLVVLRPDAVVVEGTEEPQLAIDVPVVYVDLERQRVQTLVESDWVVHEIDLSGEGIRNVVLAAMFTGAGRS